MLARKFDKTVVLRGGIRWRGIWWSTFDGDKISHYFESRKNLQIRLLSGTSLTKYSLLRRYVNILHGEYSRTYSKSRVKERGA
jgi:hypothetical protein